MITFIVLLVELLLAAPTDAHILERNETIGAVLHIDPDDDPIVGIPATIFLDITDPTGHLHPETCTCTVRVLRERTVIHEQSAFDPSRGSALVAVATFTFPERAVYEIELTGEPKAEASFPVFTLKYPIRVQREATAVSPAAERT